MPLRAETIADNGLVAIVRLDDLSAAVPLTEALLRGVMENVLEMSVPLRVDTGAGRNWSEIRTSPKK